MARVPVTVSIAAAAGGALAGVSALIKHRSTGANVTLYAAETGGTTLANPLTTDATGLAVAWVDRAPLAITYSGSGLTSYTEYRDIAPSTDRGTDATMLPQGAIPTLVTSLPASPVDGQVVDLQTTAMATLGIRWRLVYRAASASAYKWEFVGGGTLYDSDVSGASGVGMTANTWTNPTTLTEVFPPVGGDFHVSAQTEVVLTTATTNGRVGLSIGNGTPVDPASTGATFAAAQRVAFGLDVPMTIPSGGSVRLKYFSAVNNGMTVTQSAITLYPIRVG